jgi:hypothetical protein
MPNGILDPTNAALLQTGLGMMAGSGPSRLPQSVGNIFGQAGQQGLQTYQDTQLGNLQQQFMQAQIQKMQQPPQPENPFSKINPKDYTQESVARFTQTQNPADLVPARPMSVGPAGQIFDPFRVQPGQVLQDPNKPFNMGPQGPQANVPYQDYARELAKSGATQVKVPVNLAGNKYAEVVGTKSAERDIGQHESATAAIDNVAKLDMVLNHLQTSEAITGMGSELLLSLERAKQLVMKDEASGKKVSDTELLDALLGSDVFPMIKALGIGARGLDTPAEREFLRNVMTGTTPLNKETLIRMSKLRRDIASRAVEKWNDRVDSGELDRYFELTQSPKKRLEMPPRSVAPQQTAPVKPKNGDVVDGWEFIGGDPSNRMNWRRKK